MGRFAHDPAVDPVQVGRRVAVARKRAGWTQAELTREINRLWLKAYPHQRPISERWLQMLESGRQLRSVNLARLDFVARALGLAVTDLAYAPGGSLPATAELEALLRRLGLSDASIRVLLEDVAYLRALDHR
ncbi:protein of unknown function [Candidatus Hydrogenisulfobacillus filiaventi]|uniref:HTH cro/C1-type domain-containing protein n=1 Tax=Candidatus Hydrogenisulfobacillus filiaventi TaxID=2707344 RepID=A0A6F8ZDK9_9FIRM|nr:helix-turn-helix transcriptional regulator [Bacillota bacterium]CAB1127723.1 protein of unknown function [Candidatus Hydrogenisulfobacillus filiaventi]